jgi:predicted lipoprotein with Yx(FWY)xxD motif
MSSIPVRARLALVLPVVLLLAACAEPAATTSPTFEPTPSPSATEAPTASPSASASASASPEETDETSDDATVLVAASDLGEVLSDADGNTIYLFANDTEGVSTCSGDCLANWPAVEADDEPVAGEGVDAELGTIERDDGTVQLTVNGFPAYYFAGDEGAGDTNGQGVGGVWWVVGADGEPIES